MEAYLTRKIGFQHSGQRFTTSILRWLERRIEARRARRAEAKRLQGLRLLDRATLADIGVGPIADGEPLHSIVGLNPHVIGVDVITGNRFAH
jgi:hypothetical protein